MINMKSFNEVYSNLLQKIYDDDLESQEYYLQFISDYRKIPLEYLKRIRAIFVPNNQYLYYYGGNDILKNNYDIYFEGSCKWTHFLLIPIKDLSGNIVGIVGWDINHKARAEDGEKGLEMYKTSNKSVMNKNHYFLTDIDVLEENFQSEVIFVVDGVFDAISLNSIGIPAISLLGSNTSKTLYYFLRWYSYIYVAQDNDLSGTNLLKKLKLAVPNVFGVYQNKAKDIDELLKLYPDKVKKQLYNLKMNPIKGDVFLK